VRKELGGTLNIRVDTEGRATFGAAFVRQTKSIYLDPNHPAEGNEAKMAGSILFEVINFSNKRYFDALESEALNGDLSRIDFAIGWDKIEYQGALRQHEIASQSPGWSEESDTFRKWYVGDDGKPFVRDDGKPFEPSFDQVLALQIRIGHTTEAIKFWNKNCKKEWTMNHPKDDPDSPVKTETEELNNSTIEAFQKLSKSLDSKP
jgi:hypothetical protein